MKPVLFLDVDGVLNTSRPGWSAPPKIAKVWAQTSIGNFDEFKIRWEPKTIAQLINLETTVNINWLTTWGAQANTVLSPLLNIGPFPVAGADTPPFGWEWKIPIVEQSLKNRVPSIWIDDNISDAANTFLTTTANNHNTPLLLLRPNAARGLRLEHFEQLNIFIKNL